MANTKEEMNLASKAWGVAKESGEKIGETYNNEHKAFWVAGYISALRKTTPSIHEELNLMKDSSEAGWEYAKECEEGLEAAKKEIERLKGLLINQITFSIAELGFGESVTKEQVELYKKKHNL